MNTMICHFLEQPDWNVFFQLSGLPETGGKLTTGATQQPQAAAVSDADADLQER